MHLSTCIVHSCTVGNKMNREKKQNRKSFSCLKTAGIRSRRPSSQPLNRMTTTHSNQMRSNCTWIKRTNEGIQKKTHKHTFGLKCWRANQRRLLRLNTLFAWRFTAKPTHSLVTLATTFSYNSTVARIAVCVCARASARVCVCSALRWPPYKQTAFAHSPTQRTSDGATANNRNKTGNRRWLWAANVHRI